MFNGGKSANPSKYLGNEIKYLKKVLAAESWSATGGSWANKLESDFAKLHGVKYAIAMNSGTSTLHAALLAVGVSPGDEVITPALTVIMDTTAIIHANAIPVYVDIEPRTFNIDPDLIESAINLLSLIREHYDLETAAELERRFLNAIRTSEPEKFRRGIKKIQESKK